MSNRCNCPDHIHCYCNYGSNQYGCMSFLFDIFMSFITCGLWLIWIFVREMRKH